MNRKYDSGICFLCLCYPDNPDRVSLIGNSILLGEEIVWSNHYGEEGNKDHTHVVVRVKNAQTIPAFAKNHNFPEQYVQLCGRDKEHKNAKGAIIYIVHQDEESIIEGKKQYDESSYKGPWSAYARNVLRQYLSKRQRSDNDITLILDYLDRQERVKTSQLVRWCVSHNLYSVYRRSASTLANCIREHNNLYSDNDLSAIVLSRVKRLEKDMVGAQKSLEYLRGVDKRKESLEEKAKVDMTLITEMLTRRGFYD